jgi:glucose-6-phosphate isomerase
MSLDLSIDNVYDFVKKDQIFYNQDHLLASFDKLTNNSGLGNDFLGWHDLPSHISSELIDDINRTASSIRDHSEYVVIVGIGGSYLGAKAIIEALKDNFADYESSKQTKILFAGHHLCEDYHAELLRFLSDKSFSVVVISKSGTTTEPAIAFRLLKKLLEKKYSDNASERIIAITDKSKGALKELSDEENYKTFVIPDDVGGRFSVLTPVGLLPIAIAGFSIEQLVSGALFQQKELMINDPERNIAMKYAAVRNALYQSGRTNEILVNYHSKLHYLSEWWKQLFGESEGKDQRGIFPASVSFTTDLHSLGQYVQDGLRNIFETVISIKMLKNEVKIHPDDKNLDKLNYLSGMRLSEVNYHAEQGTSLAHIDGGVPIINLQIEKLDAYHLGQLIYFFEKSCAISGYLLGVNPFDQPGVEAYKKNMFALLGKPGYEDLKDELQKKLS